MTIYSKVYIILSENTNSITEKNGKRVKKKGILLLATGFGLGLSPVAPGTVGTLLGVAIAVAVSPLDWVWQAVLAVSMALVAIPICGEAEKHFGKKDDRRIVADEFSTFPLCVLWLPIVEHPWLLAVAFLTHRVLDIIKPPPARKMQETEGGVGIVLDDVISSLYALVLNHAIWWLLR